MVFSTVELCVGIILGFERPPIEHRADDEGSAQGPMINLLLASSSNLTRSSYPKRR